MTLTTEPPATTDVTADAQDRWRRLAPWLILALFSYVPSIATRPGWVAADTKQYLYLDPGKLLQSAWSMWNPDVALGTVTHQNIGYLFPMGPYFWVMSQLGVPVWFAQRIWMGSLFFAAGAGVYLLCRLFRFNRYGALSAAFVYMLTPFVIDYITRISAITMPWAALGWMLSFTVLALRRPGWRYPAWFALMVALVGGVNATSILFVGLAPASFILYGWLITKEVTFKQAFGVVWRIGLLTLGVSLWWMAGLWAEGAYGLNVLKYTETIPTVTSTSLSSEVFRGLGYWFFYGRDASQPWVTPSGTYLESMLTIGLSFAIPIGCALAGFFTRWRYRAFAVWLVILGVACAVAAYPLNNPSPIGRLLKAFAQGSTVGLAMRSSNRVIPIMVLGLALLLGAGISSISIGRRTLGIAALAVTMVATCINLSPLYEGTLVATNLARPEHLPRYVTNAASYLNGIHHGTRVLGLPGEDFAYYAYGTTEDPIWPGLLDRPYVARQAVIQGEAGSANLLRALDESLQDGNFRPSSLAPVARLMSAGDVLLQSDLPTDRYQQPDAQVTYLRQFVPTPLGLNTPVSFGSPSLVAGLHSNVYDEVNLGIPPGSSYPAPLMVYGVNHPRPIVRLESQAVPIVISGDGEGVLDAAAFGMLKGDPTIFYSGNLKKGSSLLTNVLDEDPTLVVTDSNVKRLDTWGTLHSTYGYPQTANEQPLDYEPSEATLSLFDDPSTALQTVAVYPGVTQIQATTLSSNPITNDPESQPSNAFDGIENTSWEEGAFEPATGVSLYLSLDHTVSAHQVTFLQPNQLGDIRRVSTVTMTFDGAHPVTVHLNRSSWRAPGQTIDFPSRRFHRLTFTIDATTEPHRVDYSSANAVGFAEISIPGVTPITGSLRLPTDLVDKVGASSTSLRLIYLMNRTILPAHSLSRLIQVPTTRRFSVIGTTRLNANISDSLLNSYLGRTGPGASANLPAGTSGEAYVTQTTSSSRLVGDLGASSWAAIDGDPTTAWMPTLGRSIGQWLRVSMSKALSITHLNLQVINDGHHSLPTRLTLADGSKVETVTLPSISPAVGVPAGTTTTVPVTLPSPLKGSVLTVTIAGSQAPTIPDYISGGSASLPVGIAELGIPNLTAPSTPTTLPTRCMSDELSIDGLPVPVTVKGSSTALLANADQPLAACSSAGVTLDAGQHQITGHKSDTAPLTVETLGLGSDVGGGPLGVTADDQFSLPDPATPAGTHITTESRTAISGTFTGNGEPRWFILGQSLSKGWQLSIDGKVIQRAPILIDAFANGWEIPAKPAGAIVHYTLVWTPQHVVNLALYLSIGGLLVVLGILCLPPVFLRRRRASNAADTPEVDPLSDDVPMSASPLHYRSAGARDRFSWLLVSLAVLGGTALTAPVAFIPLAALAAIGMVWKFGRAVIAATTAALFAVGAASVMLHAHDYRWNILWPTHFSVANSAIWMALCLLLLDACIELGRLRARFIGGSAANPGTTPAIHQAGHDEEEPMDQPEGDAIEVPEARSEAIGEPTPAPQPTADGPTSTDEAGTELPHAPLAAPSSPLGLGGAGAVVAGVAGAAALSSHGAPEAERPGEQAEPASRPSMVVTPPGERSTSERDEDERNVLGGNPTGLRRSIKLFKAFRVEQTDPDFFYRTLAEDTAVQLSGFAPLFNRLLIDVGGGAGYFSEAFEDRGARCILIEPEARPVTLRPVDQPFRTHAEQHDYAVLPGRLHRTRTIAGDGMRLPFADNVADIAFSSNVLEHVPDPAAFIDEALRITKPNGTVYLSYTIWSSPWGGHETSPWHFFGGHYAAKRYEKKHGRPPGNLYGTSLFKVKISDAMAIIKGRSDVAKMWAFPRYYPDWMSWVIHVPILREFLTWNLLVIMRKDVPASAEGAPGSQEPRRSAPPSPAR